MGKSVAIRTWIALATGVASVALLLLSLPLVVAYGRAGGEAYDQPGSFYLTLGWMGLMFLHVGWYANPLLPVAWVLAFVDRRWARWVGSVLAGIALMLALSSPITIVNNGMIGRNEGESFHVEGFGPGLYVWLGAVALTFAAQLALAFFQRASVRRPGALADPVTPADPAS